MSGKKFRDVFSPQKGRSSKNFPSTTRLVLLPNWAEPSIERKNYGFQRVSYDYGSQVEVDFRIFLERPLWKPSRISTPMQFKFRIRSGSSSSVLQSYPLPYRIFMPLRTRVMCTLSSFGFSSLLTSTGFKLRMTFVVYFRGIFEKHKFFKIRVEKCFFGKDFSTFEIMRNVFRTVGTPTVKIWPSDSHCVRESRKWHTYATKWIFLDE